MGAIPDRQCQVYEDVENAHSMKAARLVHILLLLQSRGRMTADDLAAIFGVSVRTIYRDVDDLSAAGIPVFADRGPAGGYQLMDGYRTRLTGLTSDEAESLFLAGMPGPAAELGLGEMLAAAELKVLASLPPHLRQRADTVRQRVLLDAPGWFRRDEEMPALPPIAQAVWNQRSIRVMYQRWNHREPPVQRTLDPLGLVLKGGAWYLAARTGHHINFYRVSRVLDIEVLENEFARPTGFDLAATWKTWSERFETGMHPMTARVRITASGIEMAGFLLAPVASEAMSGGLGPEDEAGWRDADIPIESIRHGLVEMLKLGAEVEVIEPPELRDLVRDTAAGIAAIYGVRT